MTFLSSTSGNAPSAAQEYGRSGASRNSTGTLANRTAMLRAASSIDFMSPFTPAVQTVPLYNQGIFSGPGGVSGGDCEPQGVSVGYLVLPQNVIILIMGTPKKVLLILGNLHFVLQASQCPGPDMLEFC